MTQYSHPLSGLVLYQIYPRSFYDTEGDGVGDLQGIIRKLDYLRGGTESLNVDAIWICPFFESPMTDYGYDVSNFKKVDPLFGSLEDFKLLMKESHARGLKVFIDFIPNHTSDQHEWFKQSKTKRIGDKSDWYVWRDPKPDGSPPNSWQSAFGGSAWEYNEDRDQYYLHSFHKAQPDLNWENPEVRNELQDVMRFWLDMGVDGFRIDAATWISKQSNGPDGRLDEGQSGEVDRNGPEIYTYLRHLTSVLQEYESKFMLLEAHPTEWNDLGEYRALYEKISPELAAPFNFMWHDLPWEASSYRSYTEAFLQALDPSYLPVFCLGNHDTSRIATRIGARYTKLAALLELTMPGLSVIYYGEEIGMDDRYIEPKDELDPAEIYEPNDGNGRDPARTPLVWSTDKNGGFTSGEPWLPVGSTHDANIQDQQEDDSSLWKFYQKAITYRHSSRALQHGEYTPYESPSDIYAFIRSSENEKLLILLNFSHEPELFQAKGFTGSIALSTHRVNLESFKEKIELLPHEGVIIQIS